ncbi:MAG: carbamoyltransferase, partial [Bacteroidota bacterium]
MKILGLSAYYHDSAAALTLDGKIIAAAQEEWFSRIKHDPAFPTQSIRWCLEYSGLALDELDAIAFYDKPFLKFERLLETYYEYAPFGVASFIKAIPVWIKEKLFLKQNIRKSLRQLYPQAKQIPKILFPEHHLSHAASAFYPSPFEEAAILTIDGVGEWATAGIGIGNGRNIKMLKELYFPDSLGLLYSAFTYFLGFKVNFGEYKLMGLAPYGNLEAKQTQDFINKIKTELVQIFDDGSIRLQFPYFNYATGLKMIKTRRWEQLFGIPKREAESTLDQQYCNLAIAIQQVTEEVVLKMAQTAAKITGAKNLVLAGGVALNCVANGKLNASGIFDNSWIQPAAGDAGGAAGAALAAHYIYFEQERITNKYSTDQMQGAYLGPDFSELDIRKVAKKYKATYQVFENEQTLFSYTAKALANGNIIGWYQGRQEFGPRALGNRSILGDPRQADMQRKLNLKIKFRESFRPFAPAVLASDAKQYFELKDESPYMLLVAPIKKDKRCPLPTDYGELPLKEKLAVQRSTIPAVTHIDFSARVQTVHEDTNPRFANLIKAFKAETACSLLVNTSFNVRGEPIVCSPEDAFRCFIRTDMDYLIMGNYCFEKAKQVANEWTKAAKAE